MADDPFSWDLPDPADKPQRPKKTRRRWGLIALKSVAAVVVLSMVSVAAALVYGYATTKQPNPNKDFQTATTYVYYNNGTSELGTFEVQNRQPLTYAEIPESIKQAVVAAENRTFWTDRGISIRGMVRAAYAIARGGSVQGGSTITQQYIKILYLNQDQTFSRKYKELFLAAKTSRQLTKEEILTGYLNTIYFGRDAYGIQAASRAWFDVDAKNLTVAQAAVLASVLNSPNNLDPAEGDDNAVDLLGRYRYVLQAMAEIGAITPAEATTYSLRLPTFPRIKASQRYGGAKGFLLKMVQRELAAAGFDDTQINGGGLKVTTTFDQDSQRAAVDAAQTYTERAAEAADRKAAKLHAAIASVEVGTGEVLALYGGADYVENSRNWATTPRPTASTFKAYALAAGLEDGYSLRSRFRGNTFTPPGETTSVRNEYSQQYGRVNLIRATADSINTAYVDLVTSMKDGGDKVRELAEAAGAPKGAGWDTSPRNLPLGTPEVSPLHQAGAFATFANDGRHVGAHVVREVRDANDKVIYRAKPVERRAMSGDVADDVTYALSSVIEQGTGRRVRTLDRPVAGKTGTKDIRDDITSAWFVAYTKQISTAVMYVAGDQGSGDLDAYRRSGDRTFFGGTYPALTWADYMKTATKGMDVEKFDPPAYVNRDKADPQPDRDRESRNSEPRSEEPETRTANRETESTETDRPDDGPTESTADLTEESTERADEPTRDSSPEPTETASRQPTASKPTGERSTTSKPTATREATKGPTTSKPTATKTSPGKPTSTATEQSEEPGDEAEPSNEAELETEPESGSDGP